MSSVVSGLTARAAQQELIADNISGAGMIGQKRRVGGFAAFDAVLADVNNAGQTQLSTALMHGETPAFDWTGGPLQKTAQPLDLALQGPGFFTVQTSDGPRLTRNGHFSVNSENAVVNDAGFPLLSSRGPIKVTTGKLDVRDDGTITVDGAAADQVAVVMPADLTQMRSVGGGLFSSGATAPAPAARVVSGALEASNIALPSEMATMIQNQRMYEMLTRALQTQDEGLQEAIQTLTA